MKNGWVGTVPGTLSIQVPYATPIELQGLGAPIPMQFLGASLGDATKDQVLTGNLITTGLAAVGGALGAALLAGRGNRLRGAVGGFVGGAVLGAGFAVATRLWA